MSTHLVLVLLTEPQCSAKAGVLTNELFLQPFWLLVKPKINELSSIHASSLWNQLKRIWNNIQHFTEDPEFIVR